MTQSWYNIVNETGRADAANVETALSDNHYIGVIMPEQNHTTIMAQLASTAPNVHELLRTRPAKISASVTSGDVLNGYGFSLQMTVTVEVLTERCDSCGETQFTAPVFDCRRHRFTRDWQHIADTSAPSLVEALAALDAAVYAWIQKVDRRAA